jgi:hypothetical protein
LIASSRVQALPFIFVEATTGNRALNTVLPFDWILEQFSERGAAVLTKDTSALEIGASHETHIRVLEIGTEHLIQKIWASRGTLDKISSLWSKIES